MCTGLSKHRESIKAKYFGDLVLIGQILSIYEMKLPNDPHWRSGLKLTLSLEEGSHSTSQNWRISEDRISNCQTTYLENKLAGIFGDFDHM